MSSSGIKLQSLIRKFKNITKEQTDKNKTITNFQHNISLEEIVDTSLFEVAGESYTLITSTQDNSVPLNKKIPKSWYFDNGVPWDEVVDIPELDINQYIDTEKKGYLNNVYNTELCSESWLINLYIIDKIHANFIANDNVKIKSLHIGDISLLSAYNHYILNGSLPELVNPEWSWLNTIYNGCSQDQILKKYSNKLLQLLEYNIHSLHNINYIINEVSNKLVKINFLSINYNDNNLCNNHIDSIGNQVLENNKQINIYTHVAHAILVIKLMDVSGILFLKIPDPSEWDDIFINVLLLYCLLFNEAYIYKFNLVTKSTYLLCKNKKKISNETIYKKLVHIIVNNNTNNLFSEKTFKIEKIKIWLENILVIINPNDPTESDIKFSNIFEIIEKVLKVNTETFL